MKPKRIKDGYHSFHYEYNGWHIEPRGGCTMIRHYTCEKGDKWFWTFKLAEVAPFADALDTGQPLPTDYPDLHMSALYD